MIIKIIKKIFNKFNYTLEKTNKSIIPADINNDNFFLEIYDTVKSYTMTSPERLYALVKSVEYVIKNKIPGDFVECGVWRGGSAMAIALTLIKLNDTSRKIYLYDTFEGMSNPDENDLDITGSSASSLLIQSNKVLNENNIWCYATLEDVISNLRKTNYPEENLLYTKGKVEDTIPKTIPNNISLLRLDTDWHASTKHELENLYPIVSKHGIIIIDDYGHWQGSRKAVDEYIQDNQLQILLNRIDYTGRQFVKL